jgi:integrase
MAGLALILAAQNISFAPTPRTARILGGLSKDSDRRSTPQAPVPLDHLNLIKKRIRSDSEFLPVATTVILIFQCILRPGDVLQLRWSHVDFKRHTLASTNSKTNKHGKLELVELREDSAKWLLDTYLSAGKPNPSHLIFNIPQFAASVRALCKHVGIPNYSPYGFRHGGTTHLAKIGWSLDRIMRQGRWAVASSAKKYIHSGVLLL